MTTFETAQIITPQTYSINFPRQFNDEIIRDNIISTLKSQLDQAYDVITISGEEEIGKTTFLAQFANRNAQNTISCFLKPANQFSISQENIILDISRQAYWILNGIEQSEEASITIDTLGPIFMKLLRTNKIKDNFYIILDGFENIDYKGNYQIKEIFEQLPFGSPKFKFLLSDSKQHILKGFLTDIIRKGKLKHHDYIFSGFSLDETVRYFQGTELNVDQLNDIHKLANALPGRLKNVREIIKNGKTYDQFINEFESYSDILEYQWREIDNTNKNLLNLIAVIAHEDRPHSVVNLANFLNMTEMEIKRHIGALTFVSIEGKDAFITFRSPTLKRFIRTKLIEYKNKVDEVIIDYLLANETSIESIIELPKRLEKSKRYEKILSLLSEDRFRQIVEKKESLSFLEEQTEIGINAASELKIYPDIFKLSLQKAAILEIKKDFIWESEIEAKLELKKFDEAYNLALQSLLKEDRFKLLVFLAKKKKEKGLTVELAILETIKTLYSQINPANFNDEDEASEIASNLLYSYPDLAIDFLEKASGTNGSVAADLGLAKMAILLKKIKSSSESENITLNSISSKIKDPQIKGIANALFSVMGSNTPELFLQKIKETPKPSDRLQIMRIYIEENRKNPRICDVIENALEVVILASTDITITASILEEISSPLPYIIDVNKAKDLIDKFSSFTSSANASGPTISYIKFLLNLASCELMVDFSRAQNRFYEIYEIIDQIKDSGLKTESLAHFYSYLRLYDKTGKLENSDQFESDSYKALMVSFEDLLAQTAEHHKISKATIRVIARLSAEDAISMAHKLNTRLRRDHSLLSALTSYLDNDFDNLYFISINKFYVNIFDTELKDSACVNVLRRFAAFKDDAIGKYPELLEYISRINKFHSLDNQCNAYCYSLSLINKNNDKVIPIETFYKQVEDFWKDIDDKIMKIRFGFQISISLLKISPEKAEIFHDKTVREREELAIDSPISLNLYFNCLGLSIKSYSGLFKAKIATQEDADRLLTYINELPGKVAQIRLVSKLLISIYDRNDISLFNKIYETHIKQFSFTLFVENSWYSVSEKMAMLVDISTSAFLYNRETFFELVQKATPAYFDRCLEHVCDYLITKVLPDDEYDYNKSSYKIDFEDALSVIAILEKLSTDNIIYNKIYRLSLCAKNNSFTRTQIPVVAEKLNALVQKKFPDPRNIKHDGFKILAQAAIYNIEKNELDKIWLDLLEQTERIPNIADRAYVLSVFSSMVPSGVKLISRADLLQKTVASLDGIHSYTARVERYSDTLKGLKDIDQTKCKENMRKAINDSIFENNTELFPYQKSIIDFAYEMDPLFAEELIQIMGVRQISVRQQRYG